ncbi:MAG: hypothetical protein GXC76_04950 [Rhodanobacteraceae bacterium]|jgi:uncharacterized repeat protein (TIGR01451 family)|nr:hypothetical protein [Rhodanobacteraceae bacterium]
MKRLTTAVLAVCAAAGMGLATAQQADLRTTLSQPITFEAPTGTSCAPGTSNLIVHDDGVAENGYGWQATVTDGRLADKFTPAAYPATISTVCFALITNAGINTLNFNIVVYAADGAGGTPGTVLGSKAVVGHPVSISGVPVTPTFEAFDISDLNLNIASGSVYISANWVPTSTGAGVFVASDETAATPSAGGYSWSNTGPWQTIETAHPAYRSLMIRAAMPLAGPGAPSLAKAFAPTLIDAGATSTLTITLNNSSQPTAATLASALTDTLPAGLVVAATPNASTTCPSGTVTAAAGSGSVSLNSGAQIPANGSCTVTVKVTAASNGSYVNTIPVGALATQHGSNANAASATLQVGGNGIILSGPLNHTIAATTAGTSLNIVSGAMDDSGPISGNWDFNFWSSSNSLTLWKINSTNGGQYAVDGSGKARTFQPGDVIGPSTTFSSGTSGSVQMAADWLAGTDAYLGVKFNCNGRLPAPVAGGTCYGFVHITSTGPNGFPAVIVDTGFDGDGRPITIGGAPANDPSATVSPIMLSMSAATNGTSTATLSIANAAGSSPLTWSMSARSSSQPLRPAAVELVSKEAGISPNVEEKLVTLRNRAPRLAAGGAFSPLQNAAPWASGSTIQFMLDDGSYEDNIGWVDNSVTPNVEFPAIWVNRFTVTQALTVDSISIMWPNNTDGTLVGKQVNLVAYYDADGDGNPANSVRLGTDKLVTIGALNTFETYVTSFSVPGAGDVYIGFIDSFAAGGVAPALYPAAIDTSSTSAARSYVAAMNTGDANPNLGANDVIGTIDSFGFAGNWLIRATGEAGGSGPCTGPVVPWLTAAPSSGSVNGGASTNVTITANPAAGSLAAGSYDAQLCITTNDPAHPLIEVPVSLTVTQPDLIFKDGFDGSAGNPDIVVSGPINHLVQNNLDGTSVNWITGDIQDADVPNYHFNPYNNNVQLTFWWNTGAPDIAGVSGSAGTSDFLVLQSGAVIGPASTWSTTNNPGPAAWAAGADGYLGFRFNCSSLPSPPASGICYGYVHLRTTAPAGFPATIVDYAYNKAGDPITVP